MADGVLLGGGAGVEAEGGVVESQRGSDAGAVGDTIRSEGMAEGRHHMHADTAAAEAAEEGCHAGVGDDTAAGSGGGGGGGGAEVPADAPSDGMERAVAALEDCAGSSSEGVAVAAKPPGDGPDATGEARARGDHGGSMSAGSVVEAGASVATAVEDGAAADAASRGDGAGLPGCEGGTVQRGGEEAGPLPVEEHAVADHRGEAPDWPEAVAEPPEAVERADVAAAAESGSAGRSDNPTGAGEREGGGVDTAEAAWWLRVSADAQLQDIVPTVETLRRQSARQAPAAAVPPGPGAAARSRPVEDVLGFQVCISDSACAC